MARATRAARGNNTTRRGGGFWRGLRVFFRIITTFTLVGALGAIAYTVYLMRATSQALPVTDALVDYMPGGITEIFATDKDPKTGKNVVLGTIYSQFKEHADINEIPDTLKEATIAVEDERFYSHAGVDVRGVGRAIYRDVKGGRMGEGGSTLTQQLARNIFLSQKKTLNRKVQEAILALQLEKNYSKEQILEMYLNEVCYGTNTYGVKAAAKIYFGKPLKNLTIAEAALIAGLPQRPTGYEPFGHLDAALERRHTVLTKMRELKYITPTQYLAADKEKPRIIPPQKHGQSDFKAPYFTTYVLRQLINKYGVDTVYHGGLKVYTTLNYQMQGEAERALTNGVLAGTEDRVTEGAIVSLEPRTGYIRAMVGGVNYKKNEYNNAAQGHGRQPGSSFKVFVYTAAFAANPRKYDPDYEVNDAPTSFGVKGGKKYAPKNYDGRYHGSVTIRQALTHSYNIPAVKVANEIGIERVIDMAHAMGIHSPLSKNLAVALGADSVTPLELTSAYSVFPNHGSHAEPMGIIRVTDGDGKLLENNAPQVQQAVVPETVVAEMSSMLKDVVDRGTAAGAKGIHEVEDAHGKTGTTNENRDAWFVGYTPELTTAVWVCGVKRETANGKITRTRYVPMQSVTGGHVCAPIWARFMLAAIPIQRQSGIAPPKLPEKSVPKPGIVAALTNAVSARPAADGDAAPTPEPVPAPDRGPGRATSRPAPSDPPAPVGADPAPAFVQTTASTTVAAAPPLAVTAPAAPAPTPRPVAPPRPAPTPRPVEVARAPETVTVEICDDSGQRATRWCPVTVRREFPVGHAPRGYCRRHKPLPGDG